MQMVGEPLGDLRLTRIGGHDHRVLSLLETHLHEVIHESMHRRQMIDREAEEPFDLPDVQVHSHDPLGSGGPDHARHQPRRYGLARLRLPVLPGICVPRDDRRYPLGRRPFGGVYHDQKLHQVGIYRLAQRLHDEHVSAPDRVHVPGVNLTAGELLQVHAVQWDVQPVGYPLAKLRVATPGEEHHPLLRGLRQVSVLHGALSLRLGSWPLPVSVFGTFLFLLT